MEKNVKEIGNLPRKTKINIFVAIFVIFILIAIFTSIKQISTIINNREQLFELQQKLNWERQENIKLLAQEKGLYSDDAVETEARKQFNMTRGSEVNFFVEIVNESQESADTGNAELSTKLEDTRIQSGGISETAATPSGVYKQSDLWENLKIFYDNEIREN